MTDVCRQKAKTRNIYIKQAGAEGALCQAWKNWMQSHVSNVTFNQSYICGGETFMPKPVSIHFTFTEFPLIFQRVIMQDYQEDTWIMIS